MGCSSGPEIILDNLVLHLDAVNSRSYSGTGTTWINAIAGAIKTSISSATYAGAGVTSSFLFNGTSGSVDATSDSNLKTTTNWSIGFWMLPKSYGQSSNGVIYQLGTGSGSGFRVTTNGAVGVTGLVLNTYSGTGYTAVATNIINFHRWQHICLAFNNGTLTWYKNGSSIGTSSITSPSAAAGSMNAYVGNNSAGNLTFNGNISQFRFYKNTLSPSEVLKNYNSTKGRYR